MAKYTENIPPIVVEASQWFPESGLIDVADDGSEDVIGRYALVYTRTQQLKIRAGDYVIAYSDGQKLVMNADEFEVSFKPAIERASDAVQPKALPEHADVEELNSTDLEVVENG